MSALNLEFKSLKKPLCKPQFTKGWAATEEVLDNLQLLSLQYTLQQFDPSTSQPSQFNLWEP